MHAPFTYYEPKALAIAHMHPLGGPARGGTLVTIYLADEAMLVDFGGSENGVRCRFGAAVSLGGVADCGGRRSCGGGRRAIQCRAPIYSGRIDVASTAAAVPIQVSINGGHHYTEADDVDAPLPWYRFYRDEGGEESAGWDAWKMGGVEPASGPVAGNTTVTVRGRFEDLGDARCHFGALNSAVTATIVGGGLRCTSPAHWNPGGVAPEKSVALEVTLNGQDRLIVPHAAAHLRDFVYHYQAEGWRGRGCEWGGLDTCATA